jgi:thiamine biosynthesis lipoprotein
MKIFPARGTSADKADKIMTSTLDSIRDLDRKINDLDPISDINSMNDFASERPVKVSPIVLDLLEKGLTAAELTDGVFDPTIEPVQRLFKNGRTAGAGAVQAAIKKVNHKGVSIEKNFQTVRFLPPVARITFDQLKQGYALDQMAKELRKYGVANAIIRAGSTTLVVGSKKISVDIFHPLEADKKIGSIKLKKKAFSSISSMKDGWYKEASVWLPVVRNAHGITDNAVPAYAAVIAPNAVTAEALTFALFVMGPAKGIPMLKGLRYDGVIIQPDSTGALHVYATDSLRKKVRIN